MMTFQKLFSFLRRDLMMDKLQYVLSILSIEVPLTILYYIENKPVSTTTMTTMTTTTTTTTTIFTTTKCTTTTTSTTTNNNNSNAYSVVNLRHSFTRGGPPWPS